MEKKKDSGLLTTATVNGKRKEISKMEKKKDFGSIIIRMVVCGTLIVVRKVIVFLIKKTNFENAKYKSYSFT